MKSREDHFKWQITSSLGPGSAVGKKWQNTEWNGFKKIAFFPNCGASSHTKLQADADIVHQDLTSGKA